MAPPGCRRVRAQETSHRLSAAVLLLSGLLPPLSSCLSVTQGKQLSHDLCESSMDQTMQRAQCGGGKGRAPRGWS